MAAKYDSIAADLRRRIQTGEWSPGARLPNEEPDLTTEYKVSLNTLRRALDLLVSEGLIDKRQGIGNFVRPARQRTRRTTERYQWEKDRVHLPESERRATGATEQDTGLSPADLAFAVEYGTEAANVELAEAFGVAAGTRLLRRVYRTGKKGEGAPLGESTSYLLYDMVSANPDLLFAENEPWPGGTMHQLSTVGIEIDHIVDEVTARPPTADEIDRLEIPPGVAVIALRKTSVDTTGRVVEVADIVWPGDRTTLVYTTQLKRWQP
ncbi:GntR family transcriptional regulator [Planosporangium mesophilum]|uniref:Transcriptional regulator n=1 Tax=Planosporangium mesophilum TaxID=689768 RepID=A0A8J3T7P9_9ACTN|nr:GntR family transcriptional regulator [Planosporangium mesophilum]NJC81491.1 GntR family transcriptional regulator [Planosporangium mesophilum]GII20852.1 transcriptional regulator [Planosporangium mesophilum]